MRVGDILYFSPKYKFNDLDWDNKEILIKAFRDRVKGFYLEPAKILNKRRHAFGAGVLCVTTIDFLARIMINLEKVGQRIKRWLITNIPSFDETLAQRFYEDFRNGLVHEGRIKNCGQFSYDSNKELIRIENEIMIVNPNMLLEKIIDSFKHYMNKVENNGFTFQQFRCALIRDFQKDVECAQRK